MSVKEEIEELQKKRKYLTHELEEKQRELYILQKSAQGKEKKAEELKPKVSPLAKRLYEKVVAEQCQQQENVKKLITVINGMQNELNKVDRQLFVRLDDPRMYIEEQTEKMVLKFLIHIGENLENVGLEIRSDYELKAERVLVSNANYSDYDFPTGNIGIYNKKSCKVIVLTEDFPFSKVKLRNGENRKDTEWFEDYKAQFRKNFLKKLEERFCYEKSFNLTIKDSKTFTLELV